MASRDRPWYHEKLTDQVSDQARVLLMEYSSVPTAEVDKHIYEIRDIAWAVAPFPCVGQFKFLSLNLLRHPKYVEVLGRVKAGALLLDLGCCVGQNIRKLIFDGAPSENLHGSDLLAGYLEVGYQLFRDRETCKASFFSSDVFDDGSKLNELKGQMDIIYTGLFFHLFDWKKQVDVAVRIIALLQDKPGSMLLGSQVGSAVAGDRILDGKSALGKKRSTYLHDTKSFERWWKEIMDLTGTKWKVNVTASPLSTNKRSSFFGDNTTWLRFSVEKV